MVKGIKCGGCGEYVESPTTYHTHESCLLYHLNEYREALGKQPIVVDIEAEDKATVSPPFSE